MIDITFLNSEKKDAIEELRKRVADIMPLDVLDDRVLYYRFLAARGFDLDKAERMLRKSLRWRKHHQLDTIKENFKPKEFFVKILEPKPIGCDKEGDIVLYIPVGNTDGKDVLKCMKINDYMKHCIYDSEKWHKITKQRREKGGMKAYQISVIADLNGLTFANTTSKASAEIALRSLHLFQDNYPEGVKILNVINVPSYYVFVYSLLKPLMSAASIEKLHIYGRSGWKEKLLETIDAEILPAFLGGKRTDPDGNPLCKTLINHGGWIPECYYLTDEERGFKDKSRVTKLTVFPSSKEDVYFHVTDEGSLIQWEFLVKDKDIGFGLYFQNSHGIEEILPKLKYATIDGVEIGSYKAQFTGKYIIRFDNTYSWLNSKYVEYSLTVLKEER